ncbi:hypothetical protein A2614_01090 [Candidatus Woesebacteria bacterium RIFOXYD1_FULL_40_21]|uniref:Uncharacterized protein n=1 Tax=Candidatus Woesebacteria bacterium RIFOXYD1_FULL_40_21 TaxID=1802549 RepID=A0A1F8DIZ0_9BACT|nr:MAG: hypothetical protein A2614_01090 [Candidatus Woesebacteria bacterium RIFOXYD1_FULL_40_21]
MISISFLASTFVLGFKLSRIEFSLNFRTFTTKSASPEKIGGSKAECRTGLFLNEAFHEYILYFYALIVN